MHFSLRTKLVLSFIVVVALLGLVTTWLGMTLIGERIIQQAQEKVRLDLNAAREIYSKKMSAVKDIIRFTSDRFFLKEGIAHADFTTIYDECTRILQDESLDMLTLLDANGVVLYRAHNPSVRGDTLLGRALIQKVMTHTRVTASTETWDVEALGREGEQLRQRAQIEILATPRARPHRIGEVTCGMMLSAAAPVCDRQGVRIGLLYGGVLLNGDYEIVDRIKSTVYQGESYRGRAIGTATIFLDDVRISTNVVDEKDVRAIGTCVSEEVYHHVAIRGLPWIERAFVVNDWYITAYESITDVEDANIGMLYVGMLEAPYRELKSRVLITFLSVTFFSVFILSVITLLIAKRITQPIQKLMRATKSWAKGISAIG